MICLCDYDIYTALDMFESFSNIWTAIEYSVSKDIYNLLMALKWYLKFSLNFHRYNIKGNCHNSTHKMTFRTKLLFKKFNII